jgi:Transposase C of IS166 homeodomain
MSPAATIPVAAVDPADLPDDPALLKAMLAESLAALRTSQQEGERLRARLEQLLRRLFGPRSERLPPDQPLLFPEPAADEAVTPPPPTAPDEPIKPRRKGHGRQHLPNTALSLEHGAKFYDLFPVIPFAPGLLQEPVADATMHLRQGYAPAVGPRGKKAGACARAGGLAAAAATPA